MVVKRSPTPGRRLAAFPRGRNGGGWVLHILAWVLGPPISLIVLFLILSSH